MRKTIAALLAAGTLVAPVAVSAVPAATGHHPARNVARQACKAERGALGTKAFRLKYGGRHALAHCVKAQLPGDRKAAAQCRAERKQIGKSAFRAKYGVPGPLKRCVKAATAP
jgi:hypothetical protein